jgi:hypothetical protein
MLTKHRVDTVVFEKVMNHASMFAAHVYSGFAAILTSICEKLKIPYSGFGVKTIKKFITGHGNASKAEAINAAKISDHQPVDDNEADPLALLLLAENSFIKENKIMNNENTNPNQNNYYASLRNAVHEVKVCNAKYNTRDGNVFEDSCKYSQVTGRLAQDSRSRQTFSHG